MRPTLCQPIDVMRKFDPQVTQSALENLTEGVSPIGNDDWEKIASRIEGVESELRQRRDRPYLRRQAGHPDNPETWVTPTRVDFEDGSRRPGIFIDLPDDMISEVHGVQIRESFDDFRDVDEDWYSLNPHDGTIRIRLSYLPKPIRSWISHDGFNVRVCYEYGALGGSDGRAWQSETTEQIDEQTSSITPLSMTTDSVAQPPPSGGVMVIDGEYVSTELASDGLTLTARGLRGTSPEPHDSGSVIHYCPMFVREGIAAKTSIEIATYVDKIDEAVGEQFSPQEKRDQWQSEWEDLLGTSAGFSSL